MIHICISFPIFCVCQKITIIRVYCFLLNSYSKSCFSLQINELADKKKCRKRGKFWFMVYLKFQLKPCLKPFFNRTVSFKKVFNLRLSLWNVFLNYIFFKKCFFLKYIAWVVFFWWDHLIKKKQLSVRFYFRWYIVRLGVDVLARKIRFAMTEKID